MRNLCSFSSKSRNTMANRGHFEPFWEINFVKLKSLIKNFPKEIQKVFRRLRPQEPKLPSSGTHWGGDLFTRYLGVCRVYAQLLLVFEQIPEYFGRPGSFWAFLSLFCRKIIGCKLYKMTSNSTHLYQISCSYQRLRLISYSLYVINLRAYTLIRTWYLI